MDRRTVDAGVMPRHAARLLLAVFVVVALCGAPAPAERRRAQTIPIRPPRSGRTTPAIPTAIARIANPFRAPCLKPGDSGASSPSSQSPPPGLGRPRTFGQRTGCRLSGHVPDPACTPGGYSRGATQCDLPQRLLGQRPTRQRVDQGQGLRRVRHRPPQLRGPYEIDHLVPLEAGGSNQLANLFPQPASPRLGFVRRITWRTPSTTASAMTARRCGRCSGAWRRTGSRAVPGLGELRARRGRSDWLSRHDRRRDNRMQSLRDRDVARNQPSGKPGGPRLRRASAACRAGDHARRGLMLTALMKGRSTRACRCASTDAWSRPDARGSQCRAFLPPRWTVRRRSWGTSAKVWIKCLLLWEWSWPQIGEIPHNHAVFTTSLKVASARA